MLVQQFLGILSCDIGSGKVHLGRILAIHATAADIGKRLVGIHNDLPARQTRIALKTADRESARRIDQETVDPQAIGSTQFRHIIL